MKKFLEQEKRNIILSLVIVVLLVAIDEVIKGLIYHLDRNAIGNCEGSESLIHYHPVFNEAGSFLNLKLDLEYQYPMFLGMALVGIAVGIYLLYYIFKTRQRFDCSGLLFIPTSIFLAASDW